MLLIVSIILVICTLPGFLEITLLTFSNVFLKDKKNKKIKKDIKLAVLIPAHNEEKLIKRCIKSIKKSSDLGYSYDIIVIADNCTDKTIEISKSENVKVLERNNKEKRGKGFALKYAMEKLKNENYYGYIIIDADSIIKENLIEEFGNAFLNGALAVQCLNFVNEPYISRRNSLMHLALMSMNGLRPLGREKLGISAGILGNGFALSKQLIDEIGYNVNSIAEDIEYHLEIINSGKKVKFLKDTAVYSDFPTTEEGAKSQRARWEGGKFYLQKKYFFKLLKEVFKGKFHLIEPLLDLMILPLAFQVTLLLIIGIIGGTGFKIYSLINIFIISFHIVLSVLYFGKLKDLLIIFEVPKYIFWKIINLPLILSHSKKNTEWIRTDRK
ncbi:cellulose synthase/poly-beta-1,6-N-acetylglucosamine synthase-like glycosyltransferase [Hypnocyclicus thermotrophus]|uniref:Cellulose synthase/poly-beta-1,6-N-acetylglucosamine synthase-like glycosyltransferase n=1 Tax=Hypnocyclicus thermotrophus TaxID=1627895 RepID=A0AA46I6K2_9FUSO|nr:glycosyltransferase family 2 protein [Hypnocyclicus thermotrophus]TDT72447.1 cellulose synthase/poly-beta-1,6-N-acetylglucosamine synthase-like glycosyltransferase [Hypnocyclicus thermotrophus]